MDPNPNDNCLIRNETSTYRGFHSAFAALLSYSGVVVRVRGLSFANRKMCARPPLTTLAITMSIDITNSSNNHNHMFVIDDVLTIRINSHAVLML